MVANVLQISEKYLGNVGGLFGWCIGRYKRPAAVSSLQTRTSDVNLEIDIYNDVVRYYAKRAGYFCKQRQVNRL